jgi:hypothetical protein
VYIISNLCIYAFRLERQTIAEVQTSSIAKIVENLNKNERHTDKIIPEKVDESLKIMNIINKRDLELRLDGCTRFQALPGNRLMILTEKINQNFIVHFRFD